MDIIFDDRQEFKKLNEDLLEKIKSVINECLDYEGYSDDYEVSLSFVTNDEIRTLNRDYRGIDKVTDVLSFPLLTDDEFDVDYEEQSLGDIVISIERANEQAKEYNHKIGRASCRERV